MGWLKVKELNGILGMESCFSAFTGILRSSREITSASVHTGGH